MSQLDFGNLSSPLSGTALVDTYLEPWRDALHSLHSGSSRPSYATAGMIWLDTSTTPWILKQFDGTDDIALMEVNISTNEVNYTGNITAATGMQILIDDSVTAAGGGLPLAFDGDDDTGFYRPSANVAAAVAGGSEIFRWSGIGALFGGTYSPNYALAVHAPSTTVFGITNNTTGTTGSDGGAIVMANNVMRVQNQEADELQFWTSNVDRGGFAANGDFNVNDAFLARVTASGNNIVKGTTFVMSFCPTSTQQNTSTNYYNGASQSTDGSLNNAPMPCAAELIGMHSHANSGPTPGNATVYPVKNNVVISGQSINFTSGSETKSVLGTPTSFSAADRVGVRVDTAASAAASWYHTHLLFRAT